MPEPATIKLSSEASGREGPTATTITVRDINPADKEWLQREARRLGLSMEELVRRLIHTARERAKLRTSPSEAFRELFGEKHGVELPTLRRFAYRPLDFRDEGGG